jgi:hypothetical protein
VQQTSKIDEASDWLNRWLKAEAAKSTNTDPVELTLWARPD